MTYRFLLPRDDDDQSELEEEGPWLIQAYLQYSKLLGRLTQNIDGTLHVATQWRDRFNGLEKPRWSEKDELYYRSILNHENRLGQTNIALLEELKAQVNVHRTYLESLKQAVSCRVIRGRDGQSADQLSSADGVAATKGVQRVETVHHRGHKAGRGCQVVHVRLSSPLGFHEDDADCSRYATVVFLPMSFSAVRRIFPIPDYLGH